MKSSEVKKRFWSAYVLAMIGNDDGLNVIKEGLNSEDWQIKLRSAGVLFLKDMATQNEVDILISDRFRKRQGGFLGFDMTATSFLTKKFTESDIPAYIKGLRSANQDVRKYSIQDLLQIGSLSIEMELCEIEMPKSTYDPAKQPNQQMAEIAKWEKWWGSVETKVTRMFGENMERRKKRSIEEQTNEKLRELKWQITYLSEDYNVVQIEKIMRICGKDSMGYDENALPTKLQNAIAKWKSWLKENQNTLSWDPGKTVLIKRVDNVTKRLEEKIATIEIAVLELCKTQYDFESGINDINEMVDERIAKLCPYPTNMKTPSREDRLKVVKWWQEWLRKNRNRLYWDIEQDILNIN